IAPAPSAGKPPTGPAAYSAPVGQPGSQGFPGTPVEPPVFDDEALPSRKPAPTEPVAVKDITELISATDLLAPRTSSSADSVDALRPLFEPEEFVEKVKRTDKSKRRRPSKKLVAAVLAIVVLSGGGYYASRYIPTTPASPAMGTLDVQSNPPGVQVFID